MHSADLVQKGHLDDVRKLISVDVCLDASVLAAGTLFHGLSPFIKDLIFLRCQVGKQQEGAIILFAESNGDERANQDYFLTQTEFFLGFLNGELEGRKCVFSPVFSTSNIDPVVLLSRKSHFVEVHTSPDFETKCFIVICTVISENQGNIKISDIIGG